MVKAIIFCVQADNFKTRKIRGELLQYGETCKLGYKKCTGQGCKKFEGNQKWMDYLARREEWKKQWR